MFQPIVRILAALVLVVLAGGCGSKSTGGEKTVLTVACPVAIDVESFNGDVIIHTDPKYMDRATVSITREAVHGYGRDKEAKASLQQIESHITTDVGQHGPVVVVRTMTTHAEPHYQRAHVKITTGAVDGVRVRTTNGKVYVLGGRGPVDIASSRGDVRVITPLPMTEPVTIVNRDGAIDYRIRAESTGTFDCATVNGKVVPRSHYGRLTVNPVSESHTRLVLNRGTNPVTMRTTNGDIRIAIIDDPEDVGMLIVDP